MTANCIHRRGLKCLAGHYGGKPSNGVCAVCEHRQQVIDGPALVPHSALPMPIPEDHDVEQERKRRSCCDPPRVD